MQLPYGLTPKQAATVAFVSAFVTIIGGLLLALWFRKRNQKEMTLALTAYRDSRNDDPCREPGYRL